MDAQGHRCTLDDSETTHAELIRELMPATSAKVGNLFVTLIGFFCRLAGAHDTAVWVKLACRRRCAKANARPM